MKNIFKSGVKRILAGALAAATVVSALPLQSLAAEIKPTAEEPEINLMSFDAGKTVYSLYSTDFVPSDGDKTVDNSAFYYRYYDYKSDSWKIAYHDGTTAASRLLIADSPTAAQGEYSICLEPGKDFEDGIKYTTYTRQSSKWREKILEAISKGYSTAKADQYISLAMYYGLNGAYYENVRNSAVSGSNADDWVIATQVLVWEFQQGLRTGLTGSAGSNSSMQSRTLDGHTLSWNTFQKRLGGSGTNMAILITIFNPS